MLAGMAVVAGEAVEWARIDSESAANQQQITPPKSTNPVTGTGFARLSGAGHECPDTPAVGSAYLPVST